MLRCLPLGPGKVSAAEQRCHDLVGFKHASDSQCELSCVCYLTCGDTGSWVVAQASGLGAHGAAVRHGVWVPLQGLRCCGAQAVGAQASGLAACGSRSLQAGSDGSWT